MGILKIRKAKRAGARLVIGIAGISGSGKTYTAIQLAFGLANLDSAKVGFLDTENRRGSLYSEILRNEADEIQEFNVGDLDAPFSPDRYKQAILEFQAAGVEVLVIDSISHEWEGQGGCHDIASPPGSNLKVKKWNDAKAQHKSLMNALLQSDMHIIVCIRARQKTEIKKINGETTYVALGVQPIQEENFMFEMTASLMMWDEGRMQQILKCPEELRPILGREQGFITPADGLALRSWVDGAEALDAELERAKNTLRTTTESGLVELQKAWVKLPAAMRKRISADGKCPDDLKNSATEFDKQRVEAQAGGVELADLNKQVTA